MDQWPDVGLQLSAWLVRINIGRAGLFRGRERQVPDVISNFSHAGRLHACTPCVAGAPGNRCRRRGVWMQQRSRRHTLRRCARCGRRSGHRQLLRLGGNGRGGRRCGWCAGRWHYRRSERAQRTRSILSCAADVERLPHARLVRRDGSLQRLHQFKRVACVRCGPHRSVVDHSYHAFTINDVSHPSRKQAE